MFWFLYKIVWNASHSKYSARYDKNVCFDFQYNFCRNNKMCFDFLYKFFWNASHSKNSARYEKKGVLIFSTTFVRIIKCVLIFCTNLSKTLLILRTQLDMIKNVIYWTSCEVPFILYNFNWTLIFSTNFRKIYKYEISFKSV